MNLSAPSYVGAGMPTKAMRMQSMLVSIVIVTWNRRDDILETIQSVYDQQYSNIEIVVVDNGSSDGTVEAIHERYPAVNVVALTENTGASVGRNIGISYARGDIVFFLDSDASLDHDAVNRVVQTFERMPEVGAIACKVVNFYTRQLDSVAGWVFSERVKARQDEEFTCFTVSECGSAFRKQLLDQIGGFWDYLFFGREGEELCLRVWGAGQQIRYVPSAKVYHRVSPHKRYEGGNREYHQIRNILAIYSTRYTWWMLLLFLPLKLTSIIVKGLTKRQMPDVLRALYHVVLDLPILLRQRRPLSNRAARTYVMLHRDHGALSWNLRDWLTHKANLSIDSLSIAGRLRRVRKR